MAIPPSSQSDETRARYILITQCLQNDFFLNTHSRLCLPEDEAARVLLGRQGFETVQNRSEAGASRRKRVANGIKQNVDMLREYQAGTDYQPPGFTVDALGRRKVLGGSIEQGPLAQFLRAVIEPRMTAPASAPIPRLHVINVRDWHERTAFYDYERRQYGAHCEAGSYGAQYVTGLEQWLDLNPDRNPYDCNKHGPRGFVARPVTQIAEPRPEGADSGKPEGPASQPSGLHIVEYNSNLTFYHVHSDSVFDFKPTFYYADGHPTLHMPDGHEPHQVSPLQYALELAMAGETMETLTYVLVVGVYTDIKVKILLTGLRSRYTLENLAVSDVLTAAPTIERHIGALDFVHKVLHQVEVIHSLSDLVSFMGIAQSETSAIPHEQELINGSVRYKDYASYYLDRQNVLAYVDQQTAEYEAEIYKRAEQNYSMVRNINRVVLWLGVFMLLIAIVFGVVAWITGKTSVFMLSGVTGGLTLLQIFQFFFYRPANNLRIDLENLAKTKIALESHSLRMALLRYHLTKVRYLNEDTRLLDVLKDGETLEGLKTQLNLQVEADRQTYEALLGRRFKETAPGESEYPEPSPPVPGNTPPESGGTP